MHSPNGKMQKQTGYVLIDSRQIWDIQNVKTYCGATWDSNHCLVIAKKKTKISNARKIQGEIEVAWLWKLKNEATRHSFQLNGLIVIINKNEITKHSFQLNLSEELKLKSLTEMENVETKWSLLKNAISNTDNNTLGSTERVKLKDWFDQECMLASQTKVVAYKNMLQKKHSRNSVEAYGNSRR